MDADKKINTNDLPKGFERTTTKQPEEFIDNSNVAKENDDTRNLEGPAQDEEPRKRGNQETA